MTPKKKPQQIEPKGAIFNRQEKEPDFRMAMRRLSPRELAAAAREKEFAGKHRSLAEQLAAYPPPQEEADLHGLTALRAAEACERFLRQARASGLRTVRIITGKGLHSPEGPVLPGVVAARLAELKEKGLLLSFRWERKHQARSGAVIVYLSPIPGT